MDPASRPRITRASLKGREEQGGPGPPAEGLNDAPNLGLMLVDSHVRKFATSMPGPVPGRWAHGYLEPWLMIRR